MTQTKSPSGARSRSGRRLRARTGGDLPGPLPPAPGQFVAGVFRIESLLGVGAGGSVYRVIEVDSGRARALKVFANTANVEQTLHEFRILSRLKQPGCVTVHAFGNDPRFGAYLVMDVVEGSAPTEVLPRGESTELLQFAGTILETLAYLHGRGIVHGDLKPGNVRCVDGDPTRPVLLDFGLASTHEEDVAGGTILYMAPELFRRQPRDARSDMYALGVMLYEIAAGSPPYDGATDMQITRGHLAGNAPHLTTRHRKVSEGFARLVHWLMARETGERPASAYEALASLAELTGQELVATTAKLDPSMVVSTPALVARDGVLATFDEVLERAGEQQGSLFIIHGPPGSGRTRINDELAIRARLAGARVVRWDPLTAGASEAVHASLRGLLGEHTSEDISGLVESLRRLQRIEAEPVELSGRENSLDQVADVALDVLYAASKRAPVAMLIDNATQGGPHTAGFVAQLAKGVSRARIVVVATCSTPDALPTQQLDPALVRVEELLPLDASAAARLVRTALGEVEDSDQLAAWLSQESAGNAYAIIELLRWLVEEGLLARRKGRWYLADSLERAADGVTSTGGSIARRRLERLDGRLRKLLRAAAVMGLEFDPKMAAHAAGMKVAADEDIAMLLRGRIVTPNHHGRWRLRFENRALQAVLRAEVAPAQRKTMHKRLARRIMGAADEIGAEALAHKGVLADAARHLLGSGDWQAGIPLARNAAERARRTLALGEAEELYQLAADTAEEEGATPGIRAMIFCDLGDLQMEADRSAEARSHYQGAIDVCPGKDGADARRRLGHTLVRLGVYAEAISLLSKVASDTAMTTESRILASLDIGWAYMLQSDWPSALSAADRAGRLSRRHSDRRYEALTRKLRGNILWLKGDWEPSLAENEAALRGFEALSDNMGAAESLMAMGTAHRHLARYADAVRCYERALARFEELGYRRGICKCQNNLGIVHYYRGDWPAATRRFEAFLRILERTGERIERVSLLNNLGSLYRERGMFDRAEQLLTEGLELAREVETPRLEAMLLGNLGDTFMRAGRYGAARKCLQDTIKLSKKIDAPDEIIEAERRLLELVSLEHPMNVDARAIQSLLKRAEDMQLKLEVANLLRLLANDHRQRGRYEPASECLDRAESLLADSGAALEEARVRRERGLLLGAQGETGAAQRLLQEVEATFERMDAGWDRMMSKEALRMVRMGPDAATTASHLEAIAAFCQQLGAFEDQRQFLEGVLERVVDLVGADRGFIVLFDEAGRPSTKVVHRRDNSKTMPADRLFSRTITRDAYQADEPIYIPVTVADERYKTARSVALMDVRSVVAASIRSHRRRRGVVYLDSRTPENEELRRAVSLVGALSSVIGANLEHAELLELERSRSESMAMLAHELRGPLNGIYAHLQLTREHEDDLSPDLREYLEVASGELLRLNRMITNLTDLARLEHHSSANTVVSIDIRELLSTVAANLGGLSAGKQLELEVDVQSPLPFVLGSRDRIIQVVTNLLTNAIKFTPEGGNICLRARLVTTDQKIEGDLGPEVPPSEFLSPVQAHVSDSGLVEVSVEDSGPGVPADAIEEIFGKFRQSGDRPSRSRGLGLGLAIARHIVERHGGRIWCENLDDGTGAAFRFTMPTLDE